MTGVMALRWRLHSSPVRKNEHHPLANARDRTKGYGILLSEAHDTLPPNPAIMCEMTSLSASLTLTSKISLFFAISCARFGSFTQTVLCLPNHKWVKGPYG